MKFGKDFRTHLDETLPEWRDKFLCYKPLKKLIKNLSPEGDEGADGHPWTGLEEWFVRILDEELEKFNDFYVDKEEDFVIRLQELKERIERLRAKQKGASTSESEFSEEMLEIKKAFVTIHGEMVLLKNYSSLNFAGLVKIVKKYDKRTGGLLSLTFTRYALHQPFFMIEPLTRLVHECEANLELLFPIEAEVTDAGSDVKNESGDAKNASGDAKNASGDAKNASGDAKNAADTSVHEDTDDICRSTIAALKAIQGLRRASSTCNPLSIGQFFHGQDDCSAAVTFENSGSNGRSVLQSKGADQDSVNSGD